MKLYLFEYVPWASTAYHSDGGAVIVAGSLQEARETYRDHLLAQKETRWGEDPSPSDIEEAMKIEASVSYPMHPDVLHKPTVHLFPDAGCC